MSQKISSMSQKISSPPTPPSRNHLETNQLENNHLENNQLETFVTEEKIRPWKVASNIFASFQYAWEGVSYAFVSQRNFKIHVFVCLLAVSLSIFLHLKYFETAIIAVTSGLVMALELVNTAIESIVDLTVKQTYHDLAKIAKDCAAAAVLISALVALFVAAILILPPLWNLILSNL